MNSKKVLKGVLEFWLELGGFGVENGRFGSADLGVVGGNRCLGHVKGDVENHVFFIAKYDKIWYIIFEKSHIEKIISMTISFKIF